MSVQAKGKPMMPDRPLARKNSYTETDRRVNNALRQTSGGQDIAFEISRSALISARKGRCCNYRLGRRPTSTADAADDNDRDSALARDHRKIAPRPHQMHLATSTHQPEQARIGLARPDALREN